MTIDEARERASFLIPYPIAPVTVEAEAIRTLMFHVERLAGVEGVLKAALAIKAEAYERMRAERDALIEACLDYTTYTVPDDPDPPEPYTVVECWINRLEWDDAGYTTREAAVDAVRKAAGLEPEGEETP